MKKLLKLLKNKMVLNGLIVVGLAASIFAGGYFYFARVGRVSIEDSLVNAPITSLSPTTPGKLLTLDVSEGQQVKKGDVVAVVGSEIVRAYSDGIIVQVDQQIGSIVSVQVPVVQMIDTSKMRIDGTIDENKGLYQIKPGQVVSFTVDALPGKTFWGYVDEVSATAKQSALSFSISSTRPTQQFDVYAKFDTAKYPEIKNGMSAKMVVYTK
jgi:multidrug resistance efflux pump